jgi:cell division protein FtsW (lipid II flippase)
MAKLSERERKSIRRLLIFPALLILIGLIMLLTNDRATGVVKSRRGRATGEVNFTGLTVVVLGLLFLLFIVWAISDFKKEKKKIKKKVVNFY